MPLRPPDDFLEKIKDVFNKRYKEARKPVDKLSQDWDRYEKLWRAKQTAKEHSWESRLVIPKANYIVEVLHPQILSTVFSTGQWITFKHPTQDTQDLADWFIWFCDKYVRLYLALAEVTKASPIYGTAYLKLHFDNGVPRASYEHPRNVLPDPTWRRPGDVDAMPYIIHKIEGKTFPDLEHATVTRVDIQEVQQPVIDPQTNQPVIDPQTGQPAMQTVSVPIPYEDQLYFDLDKVWATRARNKEKVVKVQGSDVSVMIPELKIAEMWGKVPVEFAPYDLDNNVYVPGRYEEYVVTAVMKDDWSEVDTIIRCEPSTMKLWDEVEGREKYYKPLVASIYAMDPGAFHGISAIQPIESLIRESEAHHNMVLDNYKRSVMSILSVTERSMLTRRDLEFRPYNIWYVRRHDDVQVVDFPGVDIGSFGTIHGMLSQEIDRTSNISMPLQGVPTSKRMTAKEFQGSIVEATRRFATYIQFLDRLTLRPAAFKILLLASQMRHVIEQRAFVLPDHPGVVMTPELLLAQHEMGFAATSLESDYSKYTKQDRIPRLLQSIGQIIAATRGQWKFNLPEFLKEVQKVYDWPNAMNMVEPNPGVLPLDVIDPVISTYPPDEQQHMAAVLQDVVQRAQQLISGQWEKEKREAKTTKG